MSQVSDYAAEWERGDFIAVGEYRLSKAEMISWRDKQTGRAMTAPMLRHTVEFAAGSVQVAERVPENTRIEDIAVPFRKGERVVVYFSELAQRRGSFAACGRFVGWPGVPNKSCGPVGGEGVARLWGRAGAPGGERARVHRS